MRNSIYLSLILFLTTSGSAIAQSTMPRWEKDGNCSGIVDNLHEIDNDNFGDEGGSEGTRNGSWLMFGRVAAHSTSSSTYRDNTFKNIGFISTEDLYHDWAPGYNKREGNKRFDAMYLGYISINHADDNRTRTRFNTMTITKDSRVGIRTTTPLAKLDIQAGADADGGNDPVAMDFQYRAGGYRHWIRTRHNATLNSNTNAIDFYLNNASTADGSAAPGGGSVLGMSVTAAGVGIGIDTPTTKLEVAATGTRAAAGSGILMNGNGKSPWVSSSLKLLNGNNTISEYRGRFAINQWGSDGNNTFKYPFLNIETNDANMPIFMAVNDSITMQIFQDRVLIGARLPFPSSDASAPFSSIDYTLGVRGRIVASGLTCKDLSQWADFVFDDNYSLKPLDEVADYVAEKKHLPEVPSAREVVNNGIDISEMLKTQMQKIEELTLYTIEQDKQLAVQEAQISKLQQRLARKNRH